MLFPRWPSDQLSPHTKVFLQIFKEQYTNGLNRDLLWRAASAHLGTSPESIQYLFVACPHPPTPHFSLSLWTVNLQVIYFGPIGHADWSDLCQWRHTPGRLGLKMGNVPDAFPRSLFLKPTYARIKCLFSTTTAAVIRSTSSEKQQKEQIS